jgi:hypothetical protein
LMSGLSGMVYIVDRMNRGPKTEPNKSILIRYLNRNTIADSVGIPNFF